MWDRVKGTAWTGDTCACLEVGWAGWVGGVVGVAVGSVCLLSVANSCSRPWPAGCRR